MQRPYVSITAPVSPPCCCLTTRTTSPPANCQVPLCWVRVPQELGKDTSSHRVNGSCFITNEVAIAHTTVIAHAAASHWLVSSTFYTNQTQTKKASSQAAPSVSHEMKVPWAAPAVKPLCHCPYTFMWHRGLYPLVCSGRVPIHCHRKPPGCAQFNFRSQAT